MVGFSQISAYLERFRNMRQPQKEIKQNIIRYIQKTIGVTLLERELEIRNATLFIKTDPATKNEIFYQKHKLYVFLNETAGSGCKNISFK